MSLTLSPPSPNLHPQTKLKALQARSWQGCASRVVHMTVWHGCTWQLWPCSLHTQAARQSVNPEKVFPLKLGQCVQNTYITSCLPFLLSFIVWKLALSLIHLGSSSLSLLTFHSPVYPVWLSRFRCAWCACLCLAPPSPSDTFMSYILPSPHPSTFSPLHSRFSVHFQFTKMKQSVYLVFIHIYSKY